MPTTLLPPAAPPSAPEFTPPAPPVTGPAAPADPAPWHARPADAVLAALDAARDGLDPAEAAARRERAGPNLPPRGKPESALTLLVRQVTSPLVLVLLGAGALALALGKPLDGLVVLGVVALNALVGFVQEWRAARAIAALDDLVPRRATVRRAGRLLECDAADVAPGDVVVLAAGDQVPADLRLFAVNALAVDESALTGESAPVAKSADPVPADAPLAERRSMTYGGTLVTAGAAEGVVVATGGATELGRLAALLGRTRPAETPLARELGRVGTVTSVAVLAVAVAIGGVAVARGWAAADAVLAAVALAVAAIPEGLPAIVTIVLAVGVRRMARRHAVVRRLPAVETLGATTVICTDKTGTLTRNEMTARALWTPAAGAWAVTGAGYAPVGTLRPEGGPGAEGGGRPNGIPDAVHALLAAGALCNDARLVAPAAGADEAGWRVEGDPTDGALIVLAAKAGLDTDALALACPRRAAVPFDSARQWMATRHADADAGRATYVKGAPEVLLPRCAVDPATADAARAAVAAMAGRGLRVLAVAAAPAGDTSGDTLGDTLGETLGDGLRLLGLVGLSDPPRPEVAAAVAACRAAGVRVVMITGDHADTAHAIARELGLDTAQPPVTGREVAVTPDAGLAALARRAHVFARVTPEDKLRLVGALADAGEVVAMTGDGVNDAPALRRAAVGVAMGRAGTAVAREASALVLTDDHFASIVAAVEEGRRVHDTIRRALAFVLPTNLALALVLLAAVVAFPVTGGTPLLPMTPAQLLWVNLVSTVALALPFAFEPAEPGAMARPPRDPRASVLGGVVAWRTLAVAPVMAAAVLLAFAWALAEASAAALVRGALPAGAVAHAQTVAVTTLVLLQVAYAFGCRTLDARRAPRPAGRRERNPALLAGVAAILALQALLVYWEPLARLFGTAPLPAAAWGAAAALAAALGLLVAAERAVRARRAAA